MAHGHNFLERDMAKRYAKLTPKQRKRLSEGMKASWAARRKKTAALENQNAQAVYVDEAPGEVPEDQNAPAVYASGAVRSEVAPMYSLIPAMVHRRLAQRYGLGKIKYGEFNYMGAVNDREFVLAIIDHMQDHMNNFQAEGTLQDGAVREDHLAAIMWGAGTLMVFEQKHPNLLGLINDPRTEAYERALSGNRRIKSRNKK